MYMNNFVIIIIIFCVYYKFYYATGLELNHTIIITDISKAFLEVTNRTCVINKLISSMYDLNATNPAFVFKLPQRNGPVILIKRRSDFYDPQFPNVTMDYKQIKDYGRRNSLLAVQKVLHPSKLSNKHLENVQINEESVENDAWETLGLVGWSGEISKPLQAVSKTDKIKQKHNMDTTFYNRRIVKDLNLEEIYSHEMKGIKSTRPLYYSKTGGKRIIKREDLEKFEENNDIYLARANDPFGYSTHWKLRDSSEMSNLSFILSDNRPKRDVLRLYSMIKCSTGCEPLMYKRYGCYCGFLGAGLPVDGIDVCCKLHDKCYEHSNCISYLEYFVPYIWKCYRGKPLCAIDHGEWGGPRSCAARLCQCDMRFSRCLRKYACPRDRVVCNSLPVGQFQKSLFH